MNAVRANGIDAARVLTSQWCRCRETAELLQLGPVEDFDALNSVFRNRSQREPQTAALREFLSELPDDERLVMVSHQTNITSLTGAYPASGEVFVIQVDDAGTVTITGRILLEP